jgi:hypothetical protein
MIADFDSLGKDIRSEIASRKKKSDEWWAEHNKWVGSRMKTVKCDICGVYVYRALLVGGQWACSPTCFEKASVPTPEDNKFDEYLDELLEVQENEK